jgi:hypothetical protein
MVMDVMAPMEHRIAIGTNGDHHWIQWRSFIIGANGNGVLYWRHYVHHQWSQWIAIGTIFLSPVAPMAIASNRYDTFADGGRSVDIVTS